MKNFLLINVLFVISILNTIAQSYNWSRLDPKHPHSINVQAGLDYGLTYGLGYGYNLKTKWPAILNVQFSKPLGQNTFDDYKMLLGGQVRLVQWNGFRLSTKLMSIFRHHENEFAKLTNFGCDISGIVGYYRPRWYLSTEIGFDKAIVTHFRHSDLYKENVPSVLDGWYQPATGGNFYYGFQGGYSFKHQDIYVKAGKLIEQDFKTEPFLPIYMQLGLNFHF